MGAPGRCTRTLVLLAALTALPVCSGPNPAFRGVDGGVPTDTRPIASGTGGGASPGSGGLAASSGGAAGSTGTGGNAGSAGSAGTPGSVGPADAAVDAPSIPRDAAAPSSLIGYWRLDDGRNSTMAVDSSGRGHHGTLVGLDAATVWTAGHVGSGALTLAMTAGSGVRIPWSKEIDDLRAFTVAAWITRVISPVHKGVFSRQLNATNDEIFTISVQNSEVIVYIPGTGSQVNREVRAAVNTPAATWLHVAATYDGSTFRLYLNGTMAAEKLNFTNRLVSAPNDLYIGNNFNAGQNEPYQGSIDEVVLFSRALTAAKIAVLAGRGSPIGLD